jgi:RNA polymerase sigma-70 factor (ECF subfamily)
MAITWDWTGLRQRCRSEAMRVLRDPHAADDAAQEAMTRAWRQRASCRTPASPEAWVARIARNEALRLRGTERRQVELAVRAEAQGVEGTFDEALLHSLSMRRALDVLSDDERRLVSMRYDSDLSQPAIARILGVPEGTVKVRLHRIRQRLKREIGEET